MIGEDINDFTLKEILNASSSSREKIKFLELPDNSITDL